MSMLNFLSECRKEECAKIFALLKASKLILHEMKRGALATLKPSFVLAGSVPEGTRIWQTNEIDISLKLKALESEPLTIEDDDACRISLQEGGILWKLCKDFGANSGQPNIFHYERFLHFLMQNVHKCLVRAAASEEWPGKLSFNPRWKPCASCKWMAAETGAGYRPQSHCQRCLPGVTHTKLGPCLVFWWGGESGHPLTVDLIPMFPIQCPSDEGLLSLYHAAVRTLFDARPENWYSHFRTIVEKDRLLPEVYARERRRSTPASSVTIKLLNYRPQRNHIIRPSQPMRVHEEFRRHGGRLHQVYVHLKALRSILDVRVTPYVIKKVVLCDEVKESVVGSDVRLDEALLRVLSHPELRARFMGAIRYGDWGRRIDARSESKGESNVMVDHIPLVVPRK